MNEIVQLRKDLLDITRDGRVQDWNERIAEIAREAGLKPETINWNGSPDVVASSVIHTYRRLHKSIEKIKQIIDSKK